MSEPLETRPPSPDARRGIRWGPVLLIAGALSLYFIVSRPPASPAGWGEDFTAAVQQAHAQGKKLVVDFYSEGCPPCMAMDRHVLPSAAVRNALRDFVPVRVNVVRDPQLAAVFGVAGTPTFIVLSAEGKPLGTMDGFVEAEAFISFLQQASVRAERAGEAPGPAVNPPSSLP